MNTQNDNQNILNGTQTTNELEEMHAQLSILKGKLDKETIVNDRLLRESMKHKYSIINNFLTVEIFLAIPFIIIIFSEMVLTYNLSWYPALTMFAACIVEVVLDYRNNRLKKDAFAEDNIINTTLKLQRAKKRNYYETLISIPLAILWFMWFLLNFLHKQLPVMANEAWGFAIGGIIACILGIAISIDLGKKRQKTREEILEQIKELKGE